MRPYYPITLLSVASLCVAFFLNEGCSHRATNSVLYPFEYTNSFEDGSLVHRLHLTNDMAIVINDSNMILFLGPTNGSIVVSFDPANLALQRIFLEMPGSNNEPPRSEMINADGIPYLRKTPGVTNSHDIFYKGEWHKRLRQSDRDYIIIDGQIHWMRYNNLRWEEVSTSSGAGQTN